MKMPPVVGYGYFLESPNKRSSSNLSLVIFAPAFKQFFTVFFLCSASPLKVTIAKNSEWGVG